MNFRLSGGSAMPCSSQNSGSVRHSPRKLSLPRNRRKPSLRMVTGSAVSTMLALIDDNLILSVVGFPGS